MPLQIPQNASVRESTLKIYPIVHFYLNYTSKPGLLSHPRGNFGQIISSFSTDPQRI